MKDQVLAGIVVGRPLLGPQTVHVDLTNACNAACITCWDHSPALDTPRSTQWKKQRIDPADFEALLEDLDGLGSVQAMILSGMGDPLVHPEVDRLIAMVKARGWHLTVLTNLVAANLETFPRSGVDQVLVGVHGATPDAYLKFHPGWTEAEFNTLCQGLRALKAEGVKVKHVQVINRDTAPELIEMVDFGHTFGAERINYKLASLAEGTERSAITEVQRRWLAEAAIPEARARAEALGVATNLDLFARQVAAAADFTVTTPIEEIGCFMGYVYTRITVEGDVLFCCNTEVKVGSLRDAKLSELWRGPAWQALRDRLRAGRYFPGCDRCGKFEQNQKWSQRVRAAVGKEGFAKIVVPAAARLKVLA